jgi:hypothetical protein
MKMFIFGTEKGNLGISANSEEEAKEMCVQYQDWNVNLGSCTEIEGYFNEGIPLQPFEQDFTDAEIIE